MIGIFGGTFNPVHFGHIRTVLEVKSSLNLRELILVPCGLPPHRQQPDVSAEQRFQMLKLAVGEYPGVRVDPCEIEREGPSYTLNTLQMIKRQWPDETLLLIMGADAFQHLDKWYGWRNILDLAHIIVMTRPLCNLAERDWFSAFKMLQRPEQLLETVAGGVYCLSVSQYEISSTQIRDLLAKNQAVGHLLPKPVLDFIEQHGLYRVLV